MKLKNCLKLQESDFDSFYIYVVIWYGKNAD